jgi:hypothetical protein
LVENIATNKNAPQLDSSGGAFRRQRLKQQEKNGSNSDEQGRDQ